MNVITQLREWICPPPVITYSVEPIMDVSGFTTLATHFVIYVDGYPTGKICTNNVPDGSLHLFITGENFKENK